MKKIYIFTSALSFLLFFPLFACAGPFSKLMHDFTAFNESYGCAYTVTYSADERVSSITAKDPARFSGNDQDISMAANYSNKNKNSFSQTPSRPEQSPSSTIHNSLLSALNPAASNSSSTIKAGETPNPETISAALGFIKSASKIFGITDMNGLRHEKTMTAGNITHIIFSQYYNDKKIFGSELRVSVNAAGRVVSAGNSIAPAPSQNTDWNKNNPPSKNASPAYIVGKSLALDAAMNSIKCEALRGSASIDEIVYSENHMFCGAYLIKLPSKKPLGDLICVVNAENGSVISVTDILKYNVSKEKVPLGSVYVSNPLKCGITQEPLLGLVSTYKYLSGKYAAVGNEDADNAQDRIRPDAAGNFIFDPKNTHFDEVSAYFYANRVHALYNALGFSALDKPVSIIVHCNNTLDNAFYSPIFGYIEIDNCERKNDLAQEEAVLFHEYSHAVTHEILNLTGGEAGAMNEAFSDYFPASFTDDALIGEWIVAKQNRPYLRTLENTAHYPEDIHNETHDDGQIYSGALWQIRKIIGAKDCDIITHYSRYYLTAIKDQTFSDGLNAMISADRERFGGKYSQIIINEFASRGIKLKDGPSTAKELSSLLKFEALNGDKKAAKLYMDIQNGNLK